MDNYKKYLKSKNLKNSTIKNYLWHVRQFLHWLNNKKATAIELKNYCKYLLKKYQKINTINLRFFFSSRRRHTRLVSDWSSDVCSSDLMRRHTRLVSDWSSDVCSSDRSEEHTSELQSLTNLVCRLLLRSEERRVGE